MGKLREKVPGIKKKGGRKLATMNEEERQEMVTLQFNWEKLVEECTTADAALTNYRQYIRNRYQLPRNYTIDLASGVITEPEEPTQTVEEGVPS